MLLISILTEARHCLPMFTVDPYDFLLLAPIAAMQPIAANQMPVSTNELGTIASVKIFVSASIFTRPFPWLRLSSVVGMESR